MACLYPTHPIHFPCGFFLVFPSKILLLFFASFMRTPLPARVPAISPRRLPAQPGFALIIVLTLMAFLVLLFVTLTVSIQVASQVADYNLKATQARLNALYGVDVAMAQLQKFAGPDTRVTGTADFFRRDDVSGTDGDDVSTATLPGYDITDLDNANGNTTSGPSNAPNPLGGTRFWTAVWGNAAPSYSFYQGNSNAVAGTGNATLYRPTPVLLNWLVSGNENTPLSLAIAVNGTGVSTKQLIIDSITAAATAYTPNITVKGSGNVTFSSNISPTSPLTITGAGAAATAAATTLNGVLLVGPNTVGNATYVNNVQVNAQINPVQVSAIDRFIVAPLVSISVPGDSSGAGSSSIITGNYAYWVGDEGVKAKYNTVDHLATGFVVNSGSASIGTQTDYSGSVTSNITKSTGYFYRMLAPQRFALEEMSNLTAYPVNNSMLKLINDPLEAHYAIATTDIGNTSDPIASKLSLNNDPLRGHYYDLTTYSYGVLSDTMRGGLKYDLTTAFESPLVTVNGAQVPGLFAQDLQGKNILPDGSANTSIITSNTTAYASPDYNSGNISPQAGLKWDTLYNYYNLAVASNSTVSTSAIPIQPGVTPIVVGGRLQFGCFLTAGGSGAETLIACWAAFVIANPYNYAITGNLDLHYTINTLTHSEWPLGITVRQSSTSTTNLFTRSYDTASLALLTETGSGGGSVPQYSTYFPILKNMQFSGNHDDGQASVLDYTYFHINNLNLLPGQAVVYALSSSGVTPPSPYPGPPTQVEQAVNHDLSSTIPSYILCQSPLSGTTNTTLQLFPVGSGGSLSSFFFVHTASEGGSVSSAQAPGDTGRLYLAGFFPTVSVTLQMGTNMTASNRVVLQSIMGLDLTGGNIANTLPVSPLVTNGFFQLYPGGAVPHYLGGYFFWLGMPDAYPVNVAAAINNPTLFNTPATLVTYPQYDYTANSTVTNGSKTFTGQNFRTYADFNLHASNVTVPPYSRLLTLTNVTDTGIVTNSTSVFFTTVPPYLRHIEPSAGLSTSSIVFGNDTLFTNLSSVGIASGTKVTGTWGYVNGSQSQTAPALTNAVLYNLPWRAAANAGSSDLPIISLGQLEAADVTADDIFRSVSYQPANAIGNSLFTPFVSRASSIQSVTNQQKNILGGISATQLGMSNATNSNVTLGAGAGNTTVNMYDMSYLINTALWDHYYFSGVAQAGPYTQAVTGSNTPSATSNTMANSRMKFAAGLAPNYTVLNIGVAGGKYQVSDTATSTTTQPNYMPQGYGLSRYLVNEGAFNVNSTSVEAWKAILGSMRGLTPTYNAALYSINTTAASDTNTQSAVAFPRVLDNNPSFASNTTVFANYTYNGTGSEKAPSSGESQQSYMGYQALSDQQIDRLAALMVQQVRARGPFLSLSQFVNRRLGPSTDPASKEGALQTAIDALPAAGSANATATVNTMTDTSADNAEAVTFTSPYPNLASTDTLDRSTGIPGWLMQADVLQYLAPVLSARSDTFVIRAYGQVNDPLDGSVQSRAWCEAVVQRLPDYIDTSDTSANPNNAAEGSFPDNPAVAPWAARPQNNVFGRRFHLVSLRWLDASDI
jgi:hypothetical protein